MLVGVSLANGNPRHPIRGIARLESLLVRSTTVALGRAGLASRSDY